MKEGKYKFQWINRVPQLAAEKGLKRADLQKKLGDKCWALLQNRTIRYEPSWKNRIVLAELLGVDPAELVEARVEEVGTGKIFYVGGFGCKTRWEKDSFQREEYKPDTAIQSKEKALKKGRKWLGVWVWDGETWLAKEEIPKDQLRAQDSVEILVVSRIQHRKQAMELAELAMTDVQVLGFEVMVKPKSLSPKIQMTEAVLRSLIEAQGWQ